MQLACRASHLRGGGVTDGPPAKLRRQQGPPTTRQLISEGRKPHGGQVSRACQPGRPGRVALQHNTPSTCACPAAQQPRQTARGTATPAGTASGHQQQTTLRRIRTTTSHLPAAGPPLPPCACAPSRLPLPLSAPPSPPAWPPSQPAHKGNEERHRVVCSALREVKTVCFSSRRCTGANPAAVPGTRHIIATAQQRQRQQAGAPWPAPSLPLWLPSLPPSQPARSHRQPPQLSCHQHADDPDR